MAITAIVSHEVKDFDTYKAGFDAHEDARIAAGIAATAYRKLDSPNTVYVIGKVPSKEVFDEMFGDPSFNQFMEDIGVILPVAVTLLEEGA